MSSKNSSRSKTASRTRQRALSAAIIVIGTALALSFNASAAELRGRIREQGADRAPAQAAVHAECEGQKPKSTQLPNDGRYSIRGLPSGKACELWVTISVGEAELESGKIPFTTRGPVARFSGQIRKLSKRLILIAD